MSKPSWRTYRSFRNFDVENFNYELNERVVDLNFTENRNMNERYERYEIFTNTISEVTDQ